jgi:Kef-type K+ transport system membrane component KefB
MPQIITLAGQAGHLLLAWMAIIVMAQGLGRVFRHLHQPAVMGEVIGGILLGPSLFGVFFPEAKAFLFPPDIRPWIGWIAQLGIVFYMFFVGLELDWPGLRRSGRSTVAISVASILIPFLLGLAFASAVETDLSGPATQRMHYLLFVGVAMSVTAFPVLARILSETGLRGTPLGNLSLACAALNDVAAWCLLAVVISLAHANPAQGGWTLLLVGAYVAAMIWIVRPLLRRCRPAGGFCCSCCWRAPLT